MGIVDELVAAIEERPGDAAKKRLAAAFVRAAGPAVEAMGEDALRAVMGAAARGEALPWAVIGNLDAGQVEAMLELTEQRMEELASEHEAELAASRAAVAELEAAALRVVAGVIIGIL